MALGVYPRCEQNKGFRAMRTIHWLNLSWQHRCLLLVLTNDVMFKNNIWTSGSAKACHSRVLHLRNHFWRYTNLSVASCELSVASCQLIFVSCELISVSCVLRVGSWSLFCWRSQPSKVNGLICFSFRVNHFQVTLDMIHTFMEQEREVVHTQPPSPPPPTTTTIRLRTDDAT